ncbi:MAG: alpha-L-fucosidase, partial [bacterium]
AVIREIQPQILINNRTGIPEDFATPEQFIPPTGITNPDGTPKLWESCITLTTGHGSHQPTAWWGYDKNETEFKTPEFSIHMLIDVVSKGGNLLLNVGPTPQGTIRPEEVEVLEAIGEWLKVNGEAIYETTASPFRHLPFYGKATVKGNTLYVHVFDWPEDHRLTLPGVRNSVRDAWLVADPNVKLKTERAGSDLIVDLPQEAPDQIASVVAFRLDGPPEVDPFTIRPDKDGVLVLPALLAEIHGSHGQHAWFEAAGGEIYVKEWTNKDDYVLWQFETEKGGSYEIVLSYAAPVGGGRFEFAIGDKKLERTVSETGSPTKWTSEKLGQIEVPAGTNTLTVKPLDILKDAALMNLHMVTLKPVN